MSKTIIFRSNAAKKVFGKRIANPSFREGPNGDGIISQTSSSIVVEDDSELLRYAKGNNDLVYQINNSAFQNGQDKASTAIQNKMAGAGLKVT